ncbi:MAG: dihydropteroate synthase [Oscillospiraceae bacterium]|nr:dihydropteroate synthase [Oscillospiraceae bacterium]
MRIGTRHFDTAHHTYVMGILNVTPDSFSDGGKFSRPDHAMRHVQQMLEEGMDILDIGGESSRPGYQMISDEDEIARVVPVIRAVKARWDVPVSVDSYKGAVARAALDAGADMINDIWGLKYDHTLADAVAQSGAACCIMHNRGNMDYTNFRRELTAELSERIAIARQAGIPDAKIILDPGVGFAKSQEQNLQAVAQIGRLRTLGFPLLLGTSRKSVIGQALDLPVAERLEGTLATTVLAVLQRCAFVRVHDVGANKRAIQMTEALLPYWKEEALHDG